MGGYRPSDDTPLAELAFRQHGVVARSQLRELGYSDDSIKRRVQAGRLLRVHRGTYAVGHTRLTARGRWMAAVLACGGADGHAALSHHDAAALHNLRTLPSGLIHVTATARHALPGICCHVARRRLDPVAVEGIPTTSLERTLLDEAVELHPQRLLELLTRAEQQDKLDLRRLEPLVAASNGHPGVGALQAALTELTDEPGWTQSELEDRFLALARDYHLPPPLTNQYVEGILVDAFWPEHRLIVEIDGWSVHRTRDAFEDDRARDARLVAACYRVVRFTYRRLRDDPQGVASELCQMLRREPLPAAAA